MGGLLSSSVAAWAREGWPAPDARMRQPPACASLRPSAWPLTAPACPRTHPSPRCGAARWCAPAPRTPPPWWCSSSRWWWASCRRRCTCRAAASRRRSGSRRSRRGWRGGARRARGCMLGRERRQPRQRAFALQLAQRLAALGRAGRLPRGRRPPPSHLPAAPAVPQGLLCGMTQVIVQKLSDSETAKAGVLQVRRRGMLQQRAALAALQVAALFPQAGQGPLRSTPTCAPQSTRRPAAPPTLPTLRSLRTTSWTRCWPCLPAASRACTRRRCWRWCVGARAGRAGQRVGLQAGPPAPVGAGGKRGALLRQLYPAPPRARCLPLALTHAHCRAPLRCRAP